MKNVCPAMFAAFLLAVPAVLGQAAPDPCATAPQTCATLIDTQATAETRLPNTAADISVGITASDKDMPAVQRALAEKTATLLSYLRAQKAQRLITTSVSFSPQVKSQKNALDKTVGYDGSSQISFRTTPEKAAELLSGVLEHGANNISSTSFTPTEEEVAAARASLSGEATRTAIAQAYAAKAAGLHVVAVRTINVDAAAPMMKRPLAYAAMEMRAGASPAPIETAAGDQALSMQVRVTVAAAR